MLVVLVCFSLSFVGRTLPTIACLIGVWTSSSSPRALVSWGRAVTVTLHGYLKRRYSDFRHLQSCILSVNRRFSFRELCKLDTAFIAYRANELFRSLIDGVQMHLVLFP